MENWREVTSKGVPLLVSNLGNVKVPASSHAYTRIRNGKTYNMTRTAAEHSIAQCVNSHGYLEVTPMWAGKKTHHGVHRLVAEVFCAGFSKELTVNHVNGIKTDNRPENLEWVSLARNTQHQWETGLVDLHGEKQPGSKLTSKRVVYIRKLLKQGIPAHTLAIIADVSPSLIDHIRDGTRWAHLL